MKAAVLPLRTNDVIKINFKIRENKKLHRTITGQQDKNQSMKYTLTLIARHP